MQRQEGEIGGGGDGRRRWEEYDMSTYIVTFFPTYKHHPTYYQHKALRCHASVFGATPSVSSPLLFASPLASLCSFYNFFSFFYFFFSSVFFSSFSAPVPASICACLQSRASSASGRSMAAGSAAARPDPRASPSPSTGTPRTPARRTGSGRSRASTRTPPAAPGTAPRSRRWSTARRTRACLQSRRSAAL